MHIDTQIYIKVYIYILPWKSNILFQFKNNIHNKTIKQATIMLPCFMLELIHIEPSK